jgi:RNA polymerase sigma-70 factor (ECF subfamily)
MFLIFLRKRASEEKDEELLKRFREDGDIEILGRLYERYMHLVYGVCLKYIEDRDTAKDEVMNIFEKLVTTVPEQEIVSFKTWLYVVAKNHCLMLLRSRKSEAAHRELMLDDPTFFMENVSDMHPMENDEGMDEKMDKGIDAGRLEECIEKLKEEQRQCIQMFYYEGFGYKEICQKLGLEEGKVKSYIQNGKRNLKICLEKVKG